MAYVLSALVAREEAFLPARLPAVPLPGGFALRPLDDRFVDGLPAGHPEPDPPAGDDRAIPDTRVAALARALSRSCPVTWLDIELFAGTGWRSSIVWIAGAVVLGPLAEDTDEGSYRPGPDPVQVALRAVGVDRGTGFDEFTVLDLGRHRATERWADELA